MLISENGVRPDPAKVDALKAIRPPTNKQDLISFLCMMQTNSDFIPNFAQKASILRELTKVDSKYEWTSRHQNCFTNLIAEFRKATQLPFFDMSKPTLRYCRCTQHWHRCNSCSRRQSSISKTSGSSIKNDKYS